MAHVRRALHGCQRAEWAHFVRWATCRYYVFLLSGSSKREAAATSSTSTTLCARAASAGARNFLRICRPRAVGFEAPRTPRRSWRTPCAPWPLTRMLDRLANDCRCFQLCRAERQRRPEALCGHVTLQGSPTALFELAHEIEPLAATRSRAQQPGLRGSGLRGRQATCRHR